MLDQQKRTRPGRPPTRPTVRLCASGQPKLRLQIEHRVAGFAYHRDGVSSGGPASIGGEGCAVWRASRSYDGQTIKAGDRGYGICADAVSQGRVPSTHRVLLGRPWSRTFRGYVRGEAGCGPGLAACRDPCGEGRFVDLRGGRQSFARYVVQVWLVDHRMEANTRQWQLLAEVAIGGGLRWGELVELRRGDLDPDSGRPHTGRCASGGGVVTRATVT